MLIDILVAILVIIAALLILVAAIGLVRLPDIFMRLHAPTKASTLGLGCLLLASMIYAAYLGRIGFAELLITFFIFITAPVSASLMAQAAIHLKEPSRSGKVPKTHSKLKS